MALLMLLTGFSKSKWSSSSNRTGFDLYSGIFRTVSTIAVIRAGSLTPLPCMITKSDSATTAGGGIDPPLKLVPVSSRRPPFETDFTSATNS